MNTSQQQKIFKHYLIPTKLWEIFWYNSFLTLFQPGVKKSTVEENLQLRKNELIGTGQNSWLFSKETCNTNWTVHLVYNIIINNLQPRHEKSLIFMINIFFFHRFSWTTWFILRCYLLAILLAYCAGDVKIMFCLILRVKLHQTL